MPLEILYAGALKRAREQGDLLGGMFTMGQRLPHL